MSLYCDLSSGNCPNTKGQALASSYLGGQLLKSANIISFSHFKAGLKGEEMYHIARGMALAGYKVNVRCIRGSCSIGESVVCEPLPSLCGKLIGGISRLNAISKSIPSRHAAEAVFDMLICGALNHLGDIVLFTPRLIRSAKKAKRLGATTVLYGSMASPSYNLELLKSEGINNPPFEMLLRAHHKQLKYIDHVLTISLFAAKTYIDGGFSPDRVHVAPLGIDLVNNEGGRNGLKRMDGKVSFLFVGNMQGLKGMRYLLEAWDKSNLGAEAELVICGNATPEINDMIESSLRKHDNIRYTGFVADVNRLYESASVFVFPSLTEGRPKVVLEAMSHGLPILASNVVADLVFDGDNGFIVDARDTETMAARLRWFIENQTRLFAMGQRSMLIVSEYSWENFESKVAETMIRITRGGPNGSFRYTR